MFRRSLLAAATLASLPALAQTRPPAPAPAPAPAAIDRAALARIEAYLNAMRTLRARFLQVAQNGATAQGTAWISRPGRMRFDYDPPEPTLLVASGGQVMMFDRELRQPSIVPAASTPLGLLLRPEIRLSGDITVTGTERSGGFLRVFLHRTGAAAEGRLGLAFQEDPFELRQWTVLDAQGRETRVTLYEVDTTTRPDNRIFDFNDPTFLDREGMRR
ncbi:LolA family protein [Falsiroseomonas sp. CW058]|uniref:LolA family protein n=1 Tax=Falsiroseomonas sp. CW058 TaxID=3388664 RepID=UPI003D30F2DB